jgi:hypothetical protein
MNKIKTMKCEICGKEIVGWEGQVEKNMEIHKLHKHDKILQKKGGKK